MFCGSDRSIRSKPSLCRAPRPPGSPSGRQTVALSGSGKGARSKVSMPLGAGAHGVRLPELSRGHVGSRWRHSVWLAGRGPLRGCGKRRAAEASDDSRCNARRGCPLLPVLSPRRAAFSVSSDTIKRDLARLARLEGDTAPAYSRDTSRVRGAGLAALCAAGYASRAALRRGTRHVDGRRRTDRGAAAASREAERPSLARPRAACSPIARARSVQPAPLTWVDRTGKPLGSVGQPLRYRNPELSPDGTRVAVEAVDPQSRTQDIWLIELARGVTSRFTFDPANDIYPTWSPDGTMDHVRLGSRRWRVPSLSEARRRGGSR